MESSAGSDSNSNKCQTKQSKKSERNKRKADSAEINTPTSPPWMQQRNNHQQMNSRPKKGVPILASNLKGHPPTVFLSAIANGEAVDLNKVSPVQFAKYLAAKIAGG